MVERESATADSAAGLNVHEWTGCRVCGGTLDSVLDLGLVYLADFVFRAEPGDPKAPLDFCRCVGCGLLQLRHSVERDRLYRKYHYRSGINATMRDALASVVLKALRYRDSGSWLDIGANDGTLLDQVPVTFQKFALEPSQTFHDELREKGFHVIPEFFAAEHLDQRKFDVITSCAMFYDLDDPDAFLSGIASSLSERGVWINQLTDTDLMLKGNQVDNLCHEHLVYYRISDLITLYRKHGLAVIDASWNEVNGGSVRLVATRSEADHAWPFERQDESHFGERIRRWRYAIRKHVDWGAGRLWGYGASTKGFTLLSLIDLPFRSIRAVADRNPKKHGLYMAGYGIPIKSEEEMRNEKPHLLLVLPWAFKKEFVEREEWVRQRGTTLIFPLPTIEMVT